MWTIHDVEPDTYDLTIVHNINEYLKIVRHIVLLDIMEANILICMINGASY